MEQVFRMPLHLLMLPLHLLMLPMSTLASIFCAYSEGSSLELIPLRVTMVLPILLLQKPHARSKANKHIACLQKCLTIWKIGDTDAMVREGPTIQAQFQTIPSSRKMCAQQQDQTTIMFIKHMNHDIVKAPIHLLGNQNNGGVLYPFCQIAHNQQSSMH